jgi:LmbE family N-acetylglucosaminyl deacetylase
MLQVDVLLLWLVGTALIFTVLVRAPKSFRDPPRHVLICCAHSDDCIIVGAEYAYGVVQNGLTVRIAYLTCGGPDPDSDIARIRRAEALAAWSAFGVSAQNLSFLDLSESPVPGPLTYSENDIAAAEQTFATLFRSLPRNAAIIVPAAGESHVDHIIVRQVALKAFLGIKRDDILLYESPEYNAFLSLLHCPEKSLRAVLRSVPLVNRLIKAYAGSADYVNGARGSVFRDTPDRLAKKRELLRYFASQNPGLLIDAFGHRTRYRRFRPGDDPREPKRALCVAAFGGCCGPSVLALEMAVLGVAFLTAHEAARYLAISLSPAFPIVTCLFSLGSLITVAYLVRRLRRTASLESSLFVWAVGLGLVLGALYG